MTPLTPAQKVLREVVLDEWTTARWFTTSSYGDRLTSVAERTASRTGLSFKRCRNAAHLLYNVYRHGHANPHYPESSM